MNWHRFILLFFMSMVLPSTFFCNSLAHSPKPLKISNQSIYNFDIKGTNAEGKPLDLKKLSGGYTLFTLFYTSCRTICPMTVASIKKVENAFTAKKLGELNIVLFSINPVADTSEKLLEFSKKHGLKKNWHLLRSSPQDAKLLAARLGMGFSEVPANEILHQMHSRLLVLVGPNGQIVSQTKALEPDIAKLLSPLK